MAKNNAGNGRSTSVAHQPKSPALDGELSDHPSPTSSGAIAVRREYYSGPIPPASELEQYRLVLDNAPDRIIKMAEKQEDHRHYIERRYVEGGIRNETIGVVFAGSIAIISILGGIYLLSQGRDITGLTALLTPLAVLVGVYVYGKKTSKNEPIDMPPTPSE